MEVSTLLILAAVVACPLTMGAMMWMMDRKMKERTAHSHDDHATPSAQLAQLRRQEESLHTRIRQLEGAAAGEAGHTPAASGSSASTAGIPAAPGQE